MRTTLYNPQLLKRLVSALMLFTGILFTPYAYSAEDASDKEGYSELDIMKGERLFKGLLPFSSGFNDCASCHYTKTSDTINWNPSAVDLARTWKEKGGTYLEDVLENPPSGMSDHENVELTEKEVEHIKAYFTKLDKTGMEQHKAFPFDLFTFFGTGFLMLLALIDLIFTKKIRVKAIPVLVLVVAMGFHIKIISEEAIALGRTENYAPDQPIKFSHKIHAQQNQIDCNYCHTGIDNSPSAGIPSNDLCLNCHTVVRQGTNSGKFEINKIHRAKETEKPVEWIRVHNLPDHVFFSHATHVANGKLECAECHGDVEEMHIVEQVEDLSMGWCLECHRESEVDFENNSYYKENFEELHEKLKTKEIDAVTVDMVGGENCMKCHY
jgi:hypothetical protein